MFWFLAASAVVPLLWLGSHRWFMFDDWTLLVTRREVLETQGVLDFVLLPHNEHLLPGLMFWDLGLAAVFGLESYLPWTITVITALILAAWVVRGLMVTLGMTQLGAACAAPTVLCWVGFNGSLVWVPETVFVLYLSLVMAHVAFVVGDRSASKRRELTGACLSLVALLCHSGAAAAILPVVAVLALQRRWRATALASIPLLVYGAWALTWGRRPEVFDVVLTSTVALKWTGGISRLEFAVAIAGQGFRFLFGPAASLVWLGLVVTGLCLAWRRRAHDSGAVFLALVAMSVIAVAAIVHGRYFIAGYSVTAQQGRYAVLTALPLLPIAGVSLQNLVTTLAGRTLFPRSASRMATVLLAFGFLAGVALSPFRHVEERIGKFFKTGMRQVMASVISTRSTRDTRGDIGLYGWLSDLGVSGVWELHDWGWYNPAPVDNQRALLWTQATFLVYGAPREPGDEPARIKTGRSVSIAPSAHCWELRPTDGDAGVVTIARADRAVSVTISNGAENVKVRAKHGGDRSIWVPLLLDPTTANIRAHPDPGIDIQLRLSAPATFCDVSIESP